MLDFLEIFGDFGDCKDIRRKHFWFCDETAAMFRYFSISPQMQRPCKHLDQNNDHDPDYDHDHDYHYVHNDDLGERWKHLRRFHIDEIGIRWLWHGEWQYEKAQHIIKCDFESIDRLGITWLFSMIATETSAIDFPLAILFTLMPRDWTVNVFMWSNDLKFATRHLRDSRFNNSQELRSRLTHNYGMTGRCWMWSFFIEHNAKNWICDPSERKGSVIWQRFQRQAMCWWQSC
jgi:hypothetical protein